MSHKQPRRSSQSSSVPPHHLAPYPTPPTSPELDAISAGSTVPSIDKEGSRAVFRHTSAYPWKEGQAARMDGVNIPSESVPLEMKACEQILKRAKELKKADPAVAYWCCFSAAQKALTLPNRSAEGTKFAMILLDALEQMKSILSDHEAVTNEAAGAAYVENFALKVFMSADNDDRNGITGKGTIRKFVVAGQFIEVLRCFENGMTEEMEQKLQYARWKAADGAKALREGRTPTAGPPMPEETSVENQLPSIPLGSPDPHSPPMHSPPSQPSTGRGSFSSSSRPVMPRNANGSGSPASQVTPIVSPKPSPAQKPKSIPTIDVNPEPRTPIRSDSGAWSTVATPGVPEIGEEQRFNIAPVNTPVYDGGASSPVSGGTDKKNVRFMGPDGAPLSPATTHITVDSYDAPAAPPPSAFTPSPSSPRRGPSAPPQAPHATQPSAPPYQDTRAGGGSTTKPSVRSRGDSVSSNGNGQKNGSGPAPVKKPATMHPPPPPPPSLISVPAQPPPVAQPHGLGLSAPLSRKQLEDTQKHARWAISALDYDDIETAKKELRLALANLGG